MIISTPKAIRNYLRKLSNEDTTDWGKLDNEERDAIIKRRGVIVGEIEKALKETFIENQAYCRRYILGLIFLDEAGFLEPLSSKELTWQNINALMRWLGSQKIDDQWQIRPAFKLEVIRFYNRVVYYLDYEKTTGERYPISHLITEVFSLDAGKFAEVAYKMSLVEEAIKLGGEPFSEGEGFEYKKSPVKLQEPAKVEIVEDIIQIVYGGTVKL